MFFWLWKHCFNKLCFLSAKFLSSSRNIKRWIQREKTENIPAKVALMPQCRFIRTLPMPHCRFIREPCQCRNILQINPHFKNLNSSAKLHTTSKFGSVQTIIRHSPNYTQPPKKIIHLWFSTKITLVRSPPKGNRYKRTPKTNQIQITRRINQQTLFQHPRKNKVTPKTPKASRTPVKCQKQSKGLSKAPIKHLKTQ